jgi:hypothetical protein
MEQRSMSAKVSNLVVVSDTHCGDRLGLCPPQPIPLDDGGEYLPGKYQRLLWDRWEEFWREWVPEACRKEPFAVVVNGDALEGVHHGAVHQISANLADQAAVAELVFAPIRDLCEGRLYWIRGTEAHVGKSGQEEERLAKKIQAIPDEDGRAARWELWMAVGSGLVHCMHHIGTSGVSHYESTAIMKELTESFTEAGRWRLRPPDIVVRSHRHRHLEVRIPTGLGYGISFCTAGWQLKTPFAHRIAGGRVSSPQIGGSVIRQGDRDLYTRHRVWSVGRPDTVQV